MAKFSITVKPRFGDEFRASGVVHDLVYHTWSREASIGYFNQLSGREVDGRPTPVKMEITYASPLLMTEEAKVYYGVTKIGKASTTQETQINEAISGRPIAIIKSVFVMVDNKTGRTIPISDENKQLIINFEGQKNIEVR
jgi:acyl-CoA thioesterase FadM